MDRESVGAASRETRRVADYISQPHERSHAVQFYEDEAFLVDSIRAFVAAGLRAGDQVLAIATDAHLRAVTASLRETGLELDEAAVRGQLFVIDAEQLLGEFMDANVPDVARFRPRIERVFSAMYSAEYRRDLGVGAMPKRIRIRAFGEMVDILARSGNKTGAIQLEELWNEVCGQHAFALLCTYDLGSFQHAGDAEHHARVCETHTHVLPAERFTCCDTRAERLREVSRLQQEARALEHEARQRVELENALRLASNAQNRLEADLLASAKREREARALSEAALAFKELFLGVLGHDLRNPLNTILTTTRMMLMRDPLEPESQKRLHRVVASGERMQRMIEQILDATRTRLSAGIAVELGEPSDVVPLVTDIVSEVRATRPERSVELDAPPGCNARIDPSRLGQVLANLLDNAVVHGDPTRGIRVDVGRRDDTVCIGVQNFGKPIDAETQALLFEPFKRGGRPAGRSSGLGLGLYISQHVVRAHGGNIAVNSSYEAGTRFEIRLPRP